jgi:type VI secretion system protein ImpA
MITMAESTFIKPTLEEILVPISADVPCGRSMRYDGKYLAIRQAREEDDATLPMGDWERPLKKADWKIVASLCSNFLMKGSKDLQVAAWLCEAWTHIYQVDGFIAGTDVLAGLVDRFWECVHPQMEDDDDDARASPFVWINENLARTLTLNIVLVSVPDCIPAIVTLAEWGQCLVQDGNDSADSRASSQLNERPLTRSDITASANGQNLSRLIELQDKLTVASEKWDNLAAQLDNNMKDNPPSIARVGDILRRLGRVATDLIDGRGPQDSKIDSKQSAQQVSDQEPRSGSHGVSMKAERGDLDSFRANGSTFSNREEAYRHLELVAKFLQTTEPHSPTPYLIKRAVAWGRMSLAELLQEAMNQDGDIGRFYSFLGIKDLHG